MSLSQLKVGAKQIDKVWGREYVIVDTDLYTSKILEIKPGFACSLHYHPEKQETFVVLSGEVTLETATQGVCNTDILIVGDKRTIIPNTLHRFSSVDGADILEISTRHDDADVVRIEESRAI